MKFLVGYFVPNTGITGEFVSKENSYRGADVDIPDNVAGDKDARELLAAQKLRIKVNSIVLCVPREGYFHLASQVMACNGE